MNTNKAIAASQEPAMTEQLIEAAKAVAELKDLWDEERSDWHITCHSSEALTRVYALVAALAESQP